MPTINVYTHSLSFIFIDLSGVTIKDGKTLKSFDFQRFFFLPK